MTIGSLFSGACDGLSLGLEWAGLGPTIWQVEIDDDRRTNLARQWPDADRSVADVRAVTAGVLERPDIIVCSAPCQDLSSAGKRAGLDGSRSGLWYEALRVIGDLRPDWVVVENVASGARNWVPHVRHGLAGLGYSSLPVPIAASDLGAPHERARVFVVAHADGGRELARAVDAEVAEAPQPLAADDDDARQPHRDDQAAIADAHSDRLRLQSRRLVGSRRIGADIGASTREAEVGNALRDRSREGVSRSLQRRGAEAATHRAHAGWPTDLEVVPRLHGVSPRVVRWLGDSVVPQCAEVCGWIIRELTPERAALLRAEPSALAAGRKGGGK